MKKLLTLLVMVFTCQLAFCQTYDDVINQFKDMEGVEYQEMPKFMLTLAKSAVDDPNLKKMLDRVDCMKVLEISNPNAKTRASFLAAVKSLEKNYSKFVESTEDGETSIVYMKGNDEKITLLIAAGISAEMCEMTVMEGNLTMADLETMAAMGQ